MNDYEDIINLKHYNPKFHSRTSIYNRSAQFAPFAALTGYDDAIVETARLTDNKVELSEDLNFFLDMKLQLISEHIKQRPEVKVIYYEQDKRKSGGKYKEYRGVLRKVDTIERELVFVDKFKIKFEYVLDISTEEFVI